MNSNFTQDVTGPARETAAVICSAVSVTTSTEAKSALQFAEEIRDRPQLMTDGQCLPYRIVLIGVCPLFPQRAKIYHKGTGNLRFPLDFTYHRCPLFNGLEILSTFGSLANFLSKVTISCALSNASALIRRSTNPAPVPSYSHKTVNE